jgi:hypothetical protein
LSGFATKRPEYVVAASQAKLPEADRQFVALDGEYRTKLVRPVTLRGEVIAGRDRLPLAAAEGPVVGWHAQSVFELDSHNALALRYQQLDRNRDVFGDSVVGYGLAYIWRFDGDMRLTLSHEIFEDSLRSNVGQQRYSETVLRLSLRF